MIINNRNLLEVDAAPAPASLGTDLALAPIWLGHIANYSIQLVWTGTPNGSFKLQGSCDMGNPNAQSEAQKYAGVTNWSDIGSSSVAINAAGDLFYDVQNAGYNWVRVVWTRVGGSGTVISARVNVKGV